MASDGNESINNFLSQHGIQWQFITERALWKGGYYERLIGLAKTHMRRTLGKSYLAEDEFQTIIIEIEAIVNCRPLTFMSDVEMELPLRPIDFLLSGHPAIQFHPIIEEKADPEDIDYEKDASANLRNLWRQREAVLNKFWRTFQGEYLLSLRERQRKVIPGSAPQVGEICLLQEENISRGNWKIVKIIGLEPGVDGLIRTATIKFPSKFVTKRAINKLYPLEISNSPNPHQKVPNHEIESFPNQTTEPASNSNGTSASNSNQNYSPMNLRPKRYRIHSNILQALQ